MHTGCDLYMYAPTCMPFISFSAINNLGVYYRYVPKKKCQKNLTCCVTGNE